MRHLPKSDVEPIQIVEIELGQPLPALEAAKAPDGRPYRRAHVLVRLHGEPLGLVDVPLPPDTGLEPAELAKAVWPEVVGRARTHLEKDGLYAPELLSADGLDMTDEPACIRDRRTFLETAPRLSVLIPSRERPERLRRCIDSILSCEYPMDRVTLVIVDNAPETNANRRLVDTYSEHADIRYMREDATGSASARNRGMQAVNTEIVAMTDDDVLVDRHWLTEVARSFAAFPEAAVVSGLLLPLELDTDAQLWFEQYGGFSRGFDRRVFDLNAHWPRDEPLYPWTAGLFGTGNNFSFRAAALREIGGFDPALGNGTPALGGVDSEVLLRTVLTGHTVVYEPGAIVHHAHRPDYDALRRQVYAYGAGLSAYYLKTLLANPSLAKDFARKVPVGLRFALSSGSSKNAGKTASYPRELTWLERRGILYGPLGYLRSRRKYGPHPVPTAKLPR
jgi:O-antigen biosynthesis protein